MLIADIYDKDSAVKLLQHALSKIISFAASDPDVALMQARKATEYILKYVYKCNLGNPDKLMLEQLISQLNQHKLIPKFIRPALGTIQTYGNYAVHSQDLYEVSSEFVSPCIAAFKQLIKWFSDDIICGEINIAEIGTAQKRIVSNTQQDEFRVTTIYDLHELGWSTEQIVDDLLKMDYDTLEGLDEHHAGNIKQWIPVVDNNPDGIRMILNSSRQIISYWHFVALCDDDFELAMQGKLFDEKISCDKMKILGLPGDYNIYFVCISVVPKYRGIKIMRLLFDSFCDTLVWLAENDIYINNVCATAFTDSGIALCKSANMKYICDHLDHGKIYFKSLADVPEPFCKNNRFREIYSSHFLK